MDRPIKNLSASEGERKLLELLRRHYFDDDQLDRQVRVTEVVNLDELNLDIDQKKMAHRLSFDIVVSEQGKPFWAIEYDGPFHKIPRQKELDALKDEICKQASLHLMRINDIEFLEFQNWLEEQTNEAGDLKFPYNTKQLDELIAAWNELRAKNIQPPNPL